MRCLGGSSVRFTLLIGVLGLLVPGIVVSEDIKADKDDEQIGEVFGKPVYRRDLSKTSKVEDEVHRLFLTPVWKQYKAAHKKEVEPTKEEIAAATVVLDKQFKEQAKKDEPEERRRLKEIEDQLAQKDLTESKRQELQKKKNLWEEILELKKKAPGRDFAVFMLTHWKFQKHLYDNYGGGRILWQQGGTEAFDAMHKWLEAREKAGDFKITDEKLRAQFYEYWTTHNHGAFLTDDPERIKKEFVEPEWAPKSPAKK